MNEKMWEIFQIVGMVLTFALVCAPVFMYFTHSDFGVKTKRASIALLIVVALLMVMLIIGSVAKAPFMIAFWAIMGFPIYKLVEPIVKELAKDDKK
jgi:uncharacterized membrane protein YraQ (UPF0718 family)